jgi:hypothetical protein
LLNQNLDVMSGFTIASKTCSTGLRISMPVRATGAIESRMSCMTLILHQELGRGAHPRAPGSWQPEVGS